MSPGSSSEDLRDLAVRVADAALELRAAEAEYRRLLAGGRPGRWRRAVAGRVAANSAGLQRVLDLYQEAKLRAGEQS